MKEDFRGNNCCHVINRLNNDSDMSVDAKLGDSSLEEEKYTHKYRSLKESFLRYSIL